jgi:hypothetical protein
MKLTAEALGSFLASNMNRRFGFSHARLAELVPSAARLALECIGNSDALYHNVEHTMLSAETASELTILREAAGAHHLMRKSNDHGDYHHQYYGDYYVSVSVRPFEYSHSSLPFAGVLPGSGF